MGRRRLTLEERRITWAGTIAMTLLLGVLLVALVRPERATEGVAALNVVSFTVGAIVGRSSGD